MNCGKMDKKSLNNEIVRMRPEAKKVKVHTISKLNREVKRIRNLKNFKSDAQKQKLLQKADRLVEELLLMKKLKHDDISKFALSHSKKSATRILSDLNSSPESKCLSKLAQHTGLVSRVEKFRAQFPNWETTLVPLMDSIGVKEKRSKILAKNLIMLKSKAQQDKETVNPSDGSNIDEESNTEQVMSDSNDNYLKEDDDVEMDMDSDSQEDESDSNDELVADSNTIHKSFQRSNKVVANAKKYPKNVIVKASKTSTLGKLSLPHKPYDDCTSEQSEDNELRPSVNLAKELSVHKLKSKNLKKNMIVQEKDTGGVEKNTSEQGEDNELRLSVNLAKELPVYKLKSKNLKKNKVVKETDTSGVKKNISDIRNSGSSTANKKVKNNVTVNRSREMKVIRFKELLGSNKSTEAVAESNDEPSASLATKTVDSFFVSEDGKSDFFSTVIQKEPTLEQKPVHHVPQEVYDSSGRRLNRKEIRSHLHGNKTFPSRQYKNTIHSDMWMQPNKPATSKRSIDTAVPKVFLPPVEEILHPSWEAKKKQKEQFNTVFLGKKIKFDD